MKEKIKIVYHQKPLKDRQNSFFYDGEIADLYYKKRNVTVVAAGMIRIYNNKGELVHDGFKERGEGIKIETDKDLNKIDNVDGKYYWENNNWFEILYTTNVTNNIREQDSIMGDVAYTYKEAIELAKFYLKDDDFWIDIEKDNKISRGKLC